MKPYIDKLSGGFSRTGRFISSHNYSIYSVLFLATLITAVLGLNLILNKPSDEDYRSQKLSELQSTRFDTETMESIKQLNTRQQTTPNLPASGKRTNPFGE